MDKNDTITIRMATIEDAPALLDIYKPYVEETAITFEYKVPTIQDFEDRITTILKKYPYLIAQHQHKILGFAYASTFKNRAAYDWCVETSIYISQTSTSNGLGQLLYTHLEDILKQQNIKNVNACIAYPNPQSIAFHEKMGFATVAHFHKCGYKLNTWYDMVWMEKHIATHENTPPAFISIHDIKELRD